MATATAARSRTDWAVSAGSPVNRHTWSAATATPSASIDANDRVASTTGSGTSVTSSGGTRTSAGPVRGLGEEQQDVGVGRVDHQLGPARQPAGYVEGNGGSTVAASACGESATAARTEPAASCRRSSSVDDVGSTAASAATASTALPT